MLRKTILSLASLASSFQKEPLLALLVSLASSTPAIPPLAHSHRPSLR
jgi:hypothetical protein